MIVVENMTHEPFINNHPRRLSASSSSSRLQIQKWRVGFVDEQPTATRTPPYPTRSQPSKACQAHHLTSPCVSNPANSLVERALYPFLVSLVNSVECVLDSHSPQVSGRNLHAQGDVQVDPFDWRFNQMKLKNGWIIDCYRRLVDFPGNM